MTSETNNTEKAYSDQLSRFEGQLKQTMDDASLLQDVHRAIRELLDEHRNSEADIRNILLTRFESGTLRQESFQLVRKMLDRIVSDDSDTLPGAVQDDRLDPTEYRETDVIATQVLDPVIPEERVELPERYVQVGSVLRDRFLLKEKVAGGSMGVVYKALDRRLAEADDGDPWVAIKVLSPKLSRNGNALRALQQEAAKGRCLMHPNIVRFLDLDRDDELYFIVMEWLDGRSLADILDDAKTKKLDVPTALDFVSQLGIALDYAHRCGVIHADVKPANVIIDSSGQVKLFDFGVARIRQKQSGAVSKFDPAVLGAATPAYSSMQVLTGEEPVPADDVFSLACLMYRLVAGYRVFGPRDAAQAAESGMEPQRPQGLSDSQWKAMKKGLAYSRVARYSSPKVFVDDLKLDAGNPPSSISVTKPAQPIQPPQPTSSTSQPKKPQQPTSSTQQEPPIRADKPMIETVDAPPRRRWPLAVGVIVFIAGIAYVGTQTDLIDEYLPEFQTDRGAGRAVVAATDRAARETSDEITEALPATDNRSLDDISASGLSVATPNDSDIENRSEVMTDEPLDVGTAVGEAVPFDEAGTISVYDVFGDDYPDELPKPADDLEKQGLDDVQADDAPVNNNTVEFPEAVEATENRRLDERQARDVRLPATHFLTLSDGRTTELAVTLREGQGPAIIEFHRTENIGLPQTLRIEEVGFSGNRSPGTAGQYDIANNGVLEFAANQRIARTTIRFTSNNLSEPDRQVELIVRVADNPVSELAFIDLTLEDDDRRSLEVDLGANTVVFWLSQVSVRESDPAVRIDVLRLNPDARPFEVDYIVRDISATEGEDYFGPDITTISFAANQRTVRLLIPLVQDSVVENDETFVLEIVSAAATDEANINRRITVMIRDDDIAAR